MLHVRPPSLCRFAGALAQEDGIRWLNTLAPRHREFMVDMLAVRTAFIDQWLEDTLQLPRHSGAGSAPVACGASGNVRLAQLCSSCAAAPRPQRRRVLHTRQGGIRICESWATTQWESERVALCLGMGDKRWGLYPQCPLVEKFPSTATANCMVPQVSW